MRMNHYKLPAGVQDLLPEEYYNVSLLTEKLKNKFRLAGCRFLESSAIEYYDTFAEIRNRIPQRQMFKMTVVSRTFRRSGTTRRRRETCPAADTCRRAWNFWA